MGSTVVIRKALFASLATAVALAFSPASIVSAAPLAGPGSKVQVESSVELVKKHKKAKKKPAKKVAKKAGKKKSKRGSCGAYMYYSKKAKKCVDARDKK
jgi:hypothetical protein